MPGPSMRWYETDGTTLVAAPLTFTPVAGTPTAAQTVRIYNDNGGTFGSDTARNSRLIAFARDAGAAAWLSDHPVLVGHGFEVRLVGQGGTGIPVQSTAWTKLGAGLVLTMKEMPSDTYRTVESRLNVDAGYGTDDVEIRLRAIPNSPATILDSGYPVSGAQGVAHGVGDGAFSALLEGGVLVETGTPDEFVNLDDGLSYIHEGVPYYLPPQAIEIDDLDGAAEALTAGQSKWVALVGGSTGIEQVAGLRGTAPLAISDRPALPDERPLIAWVEREFDATIEQADIYDARSFGWFAYTEAGLSVTISGGIALASTGLIWLEGDTDLSLADDDDNWVWLNPGGTMTVNQTGAKPEEHSLLLYEFTTVAGSIDVATDRRCLVGRRIVDVWFDTATTTDEQEIHRCVPGGGRFFVLPLFGIALSMGDNGSGSGLTRVDIQVSESGGAWSWSSIFDDDARRPSLAHDSTSLRTEAARAETTEVPQRGGLMAIIKDVAGTPGTHLSVCLRLVEV